MSASPEVLESMGVAANIYEDNMITLNSGKLIIGQGYASNSFYISSSKRRHSRQAKNADISANC